ncbi:glycosyltransferase family 4 protein [Sphingobacterium spiritivorum]|uniref:glycosyltransferase family 4 protein n=1 Tax=Sphingobacterium spiritivorum TaxID=258 RepID=UPI003DA1CAEE
MRIGFDAKRYFHNNTGLGNYSRDLIRILSENFPENDYLLYTPRLSSKYSALEKLSDFRLPSGIFHSILPNLWRTKGIIKDLVRDNIDIYHGLSGELPIGLKNTGIKSVVTIHDLIFIRYPELYRFLDRKIYTKKFEYACTNTDKIVAISKQTKLDLMEFFKIPEERVDVIYQGCHPEFKIKKSKSEQKQLTDRLQLPEEFILNVGTIEPRKNALSIIKAIKDVDCPLVIVGRQTAYQQEINHYITTHKMEKRVFFLEGLSMRDLSILYTAAKAFVYPSIFEGFGIPIIEALYSGTPVITNGTGVFPEAGGPFSYYINVNDSEQMSYAIQSVLSSEKMQEEMKTKGLAYAQQFNDEVLAQKWIKSYSQL